MEGVSGSAFRNPISRTTNGSVTYSLQTYYTCSRCAVNHRAQAQANPQLHAVAHGYRPGLALSCNQHWRRFVLSVSLSLAR